MTKKLSLFFNSSVVGSLSESTNHTIEFIYDDKWMTSSNGFAISKSMPFSTKVYSREAHNYFSNLLPEGDVRTMIALKLGISPENDFRLLEALGGECAGALTIGHHPTELEYSYFKLDEGELKKNYSAGVMGFAMAQDQETDIRLSLAGAQDKLPVLYENGKFYLSQGNSPSSHILKMPSLRFKHLPENECFITMLASQMELDVVVPQLYVIDGIRFYLVERYDRFRALKGYERLHQEDFCQALGVSYKVKYERDGGPTFGQCYNCIEDQSENLPRDLEKMIRWLIFNVLVGNCDAHAKNISFLRNNKKQWLLSPHYDLISTRVYKNISTKLAMSIGGSIDSGTITGTHWKKLAKTINTGERFILDTVKDMAMSSKNAFSKTKTEFHDRYQKCTIVDDIEQVVESQARRLISEITK